MHHNLSAHENRKREKRVKSTKKSTKNFQFFQPKFTYKVYFQQICPEKCNSSLWGLLTRKSRLCWAIFHLLLFNFLCSRLKWRKDRVDRCFISFNTFVQETQTSKCMRSSFIFRLGPGFSRYCFYLFGNPDPSKCQVYLWQNQYKEEEELWLEWAMHDQRKFPTQGKKGRSLCCPKEIELRTHYATNKLPKHKLQ